ncbi:hypothetical protein PQ459_08510 [Chryseobacterium sp. KACC 21268]|nr:hypothetical protein PQ459_08510 [Chryseobacterium sp. KACC 21268]
MKKILITTASLLFFNLSFAQVGIGKNNPVQTLDVNGNMKLSKVLYLENPGVYIGPAANSYLLVKDNSSQMIKRYVPETADYSAISNVTYALTAVNFSGLTNYDTGISATAYYLTIGGYIIRGSGDTSNVYIAGDTDNIPMYSARAFVQNGTWRLKFLPNSNRVFTVPSDINPKNIEIRLNVIVHRKDMLTIVNPTINVDMNSNIAGTATATAPEKM